jgi:hypothetical protein
MSNSPLLNIPLIQQNQAQKYLTHNNAICALEAIFSGVLNRINTPPLSPTEGDRYIVIATAVGNWAGKENHIAEWLNGVWTFYPPFEGLITFNIGDISFWYFSGGIWSQWSVTGSGLNNISEDTSPQLGGDLDVNNFLITNNNPSGIITFDAPVNFTSRQQMIDIEVTGSSVDCSLGNFFWKNVNGNVTFTFDNVPSGYFQFILHINYTSGTINLPTITWINGTTAPTFGAGSFAIPLYTYNGGVTWYGGGA